jgi:hypothetical protein
MMVFTNRFVIIRILSLVLIIVLSHFATAQDDQQPISRTVFKLSTFHFTQNTLKVGIENFNSDFNKSISVYAGVRTNSTNNSDNYGSTDGYNGVLGELQIKKYVRPFTAYTSKRNNNYMQGIYAGFFVQGGSFQGDRKYEDYLYDPISGNSTSIVYIYEEKAWNAALGFTLGAQRVFWNSLFIDVYVGGALQTAGSSIQGQSPQQRFYNYITTFDPPYRGIIPKIGIQIGMGL